MSATELADELNTALNTFLTATSNKTGDEAYYALRQLLWDNKALIVTALRAIPSQQGDEGARLSNLVSDPSSASGYKINPSALTAAAAAVPTPGRKYTTPPAPEGEGGARPDLADLSYLQKPFPEGPCTPSPAGTASGGVEAKAILEFADRWDAGTAKCLKSGYEEYGDTFMDEREMVSLALREKAKGLATPVPQPAPEVVELRALERLAGEVERCEHGYDLISIAAAIRRIARAGRVE